jgi:hypothetical protein
MVAKSSGSGAIDSLTSPDSFPHGGRGSRSNSAIPHCEDCLLTPHQTGMEGGLSPLVIDHASKQIPISTKSNRCVERHTKDGLSTLVIDHASK